MQILKVASYNIRHGLDAGFDMELLASVIKSKGAELVGIQEMDMCADRSENRNQLEELKKALGWEYGCFLECIKISGGSYGTGVVSKYPLEQKAEYSLKAFEGGEQRKLGVYSVNVNGRELVFANTHLDYISEKAIETQMLQINEILKDCLGFILTGDFNNENMRLFRKIENVEFIMNEETKIVTFPDGGSTIDNIIYRGNISLNAFGAVEESHSDHYMLWAELELK